MSELTSQLEILKRLVPILALTVTAWVGGGHPAKAQVYTGLPVPVPPATSVARSDFGVVATGSPEATEAAVEILERGGNAIDAAVAAALMLGVSDPDASGLGGMTYIVIHLAGGGTLVIDGTSPTPDGVDPNRLQQLKEAGNLVGYEMAAVPTTLAVLERARSRFGTMDMATLLRPAIEVADRGYRFGPTQIIWTDYYRDQILSSGFFQLLAHPNGSTSGQPGDLACRPDLARTLRGLSRYGISSFYRGHIADLIERDMIRGGGFLRKSDLAMLRVREVAPLHTTYRGTDVFTVPRPGGGSAVIEALNILENFPSTFLSENTVARHHALIETFRIALADRDLAPEGRNQLLSAPPPATEKEHAQQRAGLIVPEQVISDSDLYGLVDPECAPSGESTTQVSVADHRGNVVALTQTLGRSWGAKVVTPGLGFPYNSLLENFNYDKPQCPGYLQPRARSSNDVAPTIVLTEDGSLVAALGSPGSDLIPSIVVNVISHLLDGGMDLKTAIDAPRVLFGSAIGLAPYIEVAGPITDTDVDALERIGHKDIVRYPYPPTSRLIVVFGGINAVGWDAVNNTFVGVGGGRRWGCAQGARVVAEFSPKR